MKRPFIIILLFIFTIISLSVLRVALSNKLSTTGIELENLQVQLINYSKENTILEEKVLQVSSLINLSNEAKTLGFVETKSEVFLTNPVPLALRQ